MAEAGRGQCTVCSKLLALRYGSACPRCRHSLGGGADAAPRGERDIPRDWPSFNCVFTETHKVRPNVPVGAKAVWAECLIHAVKHVSYHNDEKAWLQLFALPKMVLGAPSSGRGGGGGKQ